MCVSHHLISAPIPCGVSIFEDARFDRTTAVISVIDQASVTDDGVLRQVMAAARRRFLSKVPAKRIAWVCRPNGRTDQLRKVTIEADVVKTQAIGLGDLSDLVHRGGGFRRNIFLPTFAQNENNGPPRLDYGTA